MARDIFFKFHELDAIIHALEIHRFEMESIILVDGFPHDDVA